MSSELYVQSWRYCCRIVRPSNGLDQLGLAVSWPIRERFPRHSIGTHVLKSLWRFRIAYLCSFSKATARSGLHLRASPAKQSPDFEFLVIVFSVVAQLKSPAPMLHAQSLESEHRLAELVAEMGAWSTKSSVCLSGFNISLRSPVECQEEVGGWESFLHGVDKVVRIFGFLEFFFKNQQIVFRKIYGATRIKRSPSLAMSRDSN